MAYGYCPVCGAPGKSRERGINGNDTCENGHKYPSKQSLNEQPSPAALMARDYATFVRVGNFTTDPRDSKFLAAMGLAGEAGEVCDYLKKVLLHHKPLDRAKLVEELGDVLWYLQHSCNVFEIPLAEVLETNVRKLCDRYPHQYGEAKNWLGK